MNRTLMFAVSGLMCGVFSASGEMLPLRNPCDSRPAIKSEALVGASRSVSTLVSALPAAARQTMQAPEYAAGEKHTVEIVCNLPVDEPDAFVVTIDLMKDNATFWSDYFTEETEFDVPAGDYVLQVNYYDKNNSVYFADVHVENDMTVEVDVRDCRYIYTPEFVTPAGEPIVLPTYEGSTLLEDVYYNTLYIEGEKNIAYRNCTLDGAPFVAQLGAVGAVTSFCSNMDTAEAEMRYLLQGVDRNGDVFFITEMITCREASGGAFGNEVEDYRLIAPSIARTPVYGVYGEDNDGKTVEVRGYNYDGELFSGLRYVAEEPCSVYFCVRPWEGGASSYGTVRLQNWDYADFDNERFIGTWTPEMTNSEDGILCLATQQNVFAGGDAMGPDRMPADPCFSYVLEEDMVFGRSNPIALVSMITPDDEEIPFNMPDIEGFYGNYGEDSRIDLATCGMSLKLDGTAVDLAQYGSVYNWFLTQAETGAGKGNIEFAVTNNNLILWDMAAAGECILSYEQTQEDNEAPVLQRVMLRNSDGLPCNEFLSAEDAFITFAAGDFNEHTQKGRTSWGRVTYHWFTCGPVEVEVSCSVSGENDFRKVTVDEVPDKFFMPGFGYFFEGSLSQVKVEEGMNYYDLMIKVSDSAGNSQTQTLSPAFRIDNSSGVRSMRPDSHISLDNGRIRVSDAQSVNIYTLSGMAIPNEGLQPGLYIVVADGEARKCCLR